MAFASRTNETQELETRQNANAYIINSFIFTGDGQIQFSRQIYNSLILKHEDAHLFNSHNFLGGQLGSLKTCSVRVRVNPQAHFFGSSRTLRSRRFSERCDCYDFIKRASVYIGRISLFHA